jgi:formylmethanofuran dehydrogenase subunit C
MSITLTLRRPPDGRIDASTIAADRFASLSAPAIAALELWVGRQRVALGDLFDVRGEPSDDVRVVGELRLVDRLGAGMGGGTLTIEGPAGDGVGEGMSGGTIETTGDVGDGAGVAMRGGVLRVAGSAGDRLGAATPGASKGMTGGEILVRGNAGTDAGARVRRGTIVIGGATGPRAAHAMIAGTLVIVGRAGPGAGIWSKRGSVLALGGIEVPPTYRYACTYQPPHVPVLVRYLRRAHGLALDARFATGLYKRWDGDIADIGKGEILEWTT